MSEQKQNDRVKELKALRQRIDNWRHSRNKGRAMPKELWDAAIILAEKYGEKEVAIRLNISETSLKQRVKEAQAESKVEKSSGKGNVELEFVELASDALFGLHEESQSVLELESADGARLTMRFPSNQAVDLVGLVKAFCRREV